MVVLSSFSSPLLYLYYITGFVPCQDLFLGYLKPHSLRGFKVAVLSGYFVSLSLSRLFVLFGSLLSRSRPFASWSVVCCKTLTSPAISRSQFTAFFGKVFMLTLYHFAGPAQRFGGFSFPLSDCIISQVCLLVNTFFSKKRNFFIPLHPHRAGSSTRHNGRNLGTAWGTRLWGQGRRGRFHNSFFHSPLLFLV